ncbi:MAG TPA: hypothetical protein VFR80_03190 [Pyrinomonadaceae bacterium]|nr:hypothetical protein [Pyrinomonadaceae bacterium]
MVNYSKLDPRLSAEISEHPDSDERTLKVSLRTQEPPNEEQQRELESFGVYGVSGEGCIFSALLSPHGVSELSEKSWIRLLTLAHELRPMR